MHVKSPEYIIIARRRGDTWFIGAMTNEATRTLQVSLSFLQKGAYQMTIYADGARAEIDPKQVAVSTRNVKAVDSLSIHLAPSGGYAAYLQPTK